MSTLETEAETLVDTEKEELLFFNYHEYTVKEYQTLEGSGITSNVHALVVTHFPNPYKNDDNTRIVRVPRDYTRSRDDGAIPIFSTVLPGYEALAILEPVVSGGDEMMKKGQQVDPSRHFIIRGSIEGQYFGYSSVSPLSMYLSPDEFTPIILEINKLLEKIYSPFNVYNMVWAWSDYLLLSIPSFLKLNKFVPNLDKTNYLHLEHYIDQLNEGILGQRNIRLISPRLSGFLSLDFEIPVPTAPADSFTMKDITNSSIASP